MYVLILIDFFDLFMKCEKHEIGWGFKGYHKGRHLRRGEKGYMWLATFKTYEKFIILIIISFLGKI